MQTLLERYSENHQNPVNCKIHHICVPLIVFSIVLLLWSVPISLWGGDSKYLTLAAPVIVLVTAYYFYLHVALAVGMLIFFLSASMAAILLQQTGIELYWYALMVFVVGWIGQFIGHAIEGARPSFFEDLRFLLIGPLWVLVDLYKKLGISVPAK